MVWIKQIGFEWNATNVFLFVVSTLIMAELAIEMEKNTFKPAERWISHWNGHS